MSGLAVYLVISVFRLLAGVVDERSYWVQNILVAATGITVYLYHRHHNNRWFDYQYETHKRLEGAEADREREQENRFERVKKIIESERRQPYCGHAHALRTVEGAPRILEIGSTIFTATGQELFRIAGSQGDDEIEKEALERWKKAGWNETEAQSA